MEWTDTICLKFASQAEFEAAMPAAWKQEPYTFTRAMHVIGTLYRDDDGSPVPGFHVNVRLKGEELPQEVGSFVIPTPAKPKQVFA